MIFDEFWGGARGFGGLWQPVAACGGLWQPVAACGGLWQLLAAESCRPRKKHVVFWGPAGWIANCSLGDEKGFLDWKLQVGGREGIG